MFKKLLLSLAALVIMSLSVSAETREELWTTENEGGVLAEDWAPIHYLQADDTGNIEPGDFIVFTVVGVKEDVDWPQVGIKDNTTGGWAPLKSELTWKDGFPKEIRFSVMYDMAEKFHKNGISFIGAGAYVSKIELEKGTIEIGANTVWFGPKECNWGEGISIPKEVFANVEPGDKIQIVYDGSKEHTVSIGFNGWGAPAIASFEFGKANGFSVDEGASTITIQLLPEHHKQKWTVKEKVKEGEGEDEKEVEVDVEKEFDLFTLLKDNGLFLRAPITINQILYIPSPIKVSPYAVWIGPKTCDWGNGVSIQKDVFANVAPGDKIQVFYEKGAGDYYQFIFGGWSTGPNVASGDFWKVSTFNNDTEAGCFNIELTEEHNNFIWGEDEKEYNLFDLLKTEGLNTQGPCTINQILYIPAGSEPDDPEPVDPNMITGEWWHQWEGMDETTKEWGANTTIKEDSNVGFDSNLGKELSQGSNILGPGSCNGDCYADLTEYGGIEGTGTPGITVRLYFNRLDLQGSGLDIKVDIKEDGTYRYDFSDLPDNPSYVHLNFVKTALGWQGGKWPEGLETAVVETMKVFPKPDPLEAAKKTLTDELSKATPYDSFAKTAESFAKLQSAIEAANAELTNDKATEESLASATSAITDAISGLELEEGYAYLTAEMFMTYDSVEEPGEGKNPGQGCAYDLFKEKGNPYGDCNNVGYLNWADLSNYDKLIITATSGNPRFCMNRLEKNGQDGASQDDSKMLDMSPGKGNWSSEKYLTSDGNVYTVNLKAIVQDYTYARLHAIKFDGFVTGMYLYNSTDELELPKEALANEIARAEQYNDFLKTEDSWNNLQTAIAEGKAKLEESKPTVKSVEAATAKITDAITGLKLQEGYCELTKEMFKKYNSVDNPGEGESTGCDYDPFKENGKPYGDCTNINYLNWADLTDYDQLILTATSGQPRFCLNRKVDGGQQGATMETSNLIDIHAGSDEWSADRYLISNGDVYTVDLDKIIDDYGYARLHAIKFGGYVTGMYLYKDPANASGFNLTFDIDDPAHVVIEINGEKIKDLNADTNEKVVSNRAKLSIAPAEGFKLTSVTAGDDVYVKLNEDGILAKTIVKNISFEIVTEDADPLAQPKKELTAAIESAKLYDAFAKTEESFAALTNAIAAAEKALEAEDATETSLTTAGANINKAIKGLTLKEGYSYLTPEMFKKYASVEEPGEGEETDCIYELFNTSRDLYGAKQDDNLKWADLTKYDQLILTIVGDGDLPRFCMNNEVSTKFEINPYDGTNEATETYQTVDENRYIIDLKKIVKEHEFAHLHGIHVNGWGTGAFLNGMYLYKNPNVAVEGVTLDNTKATMTLGETLTIKATVTPDDATDPKVTWSSSNEKVATVDENGTVTALYVGTATITATCGTEEDGVFSASCDITCYPQVGNADWNSGITLNDAIHIANYVVGKKSIPTGWTEANYDTFYKVGADVNNDDNVSISDASATVEIALKNDSEPAANAIALHSLGELADNLVIGGLNSSANGTTTVAVTLDNTMNYVALQADIYVPEGVNFDVKAGSRIADRHSFQYYRFDESHVRVAIYTFSGEAFADNNEPLFEIITDSYLSDPSDISLAKIFASDSEANEHVLGSRYAVATGVAALGFDSNAPVKVFDLNGRYISDKVEGLGKGIYIIRQGNNAKKVNIR